MLVEARTEDELVARRPASRARDGPAGDAARRRIERAGRRRRHPRRRRARPRSRASSARTRRGVRAGAGLTINGLVRWTVGAASPASKPGPARPAPSAAPSTATRISGGATSAIWCATSACSIADGDAARRCRAAEMGFGYDTQPPADAAARSRCRRCSRVTTGEPDGAARRARASLAFRKRTQPLDVPSAGCIFQNPDPARDACPTASRRRPARWSIAPASRARARRRARVAAARQLHRPRRRRHGARDPRA